jgi:acyl CoA:acetate/3-ketoacid CoA transferase alpha subunit
VVVQGTNKLVVMGRINFKDHALIKRQQVDEKMNVTSKMFKDEKNGVIVKISLCLLLEVVRIFEVLEFTTI